MGDKIKRYTSVSNNGVSLVNDEALRDTLVDLCNYSAMALMLMDENKEEFAIQKMVDEFQGSWTKRADDFVKDYNSKRKVGDKPITVEEVLDHMCD